MFLSLSLFFFIGSLPFFIHLPEQHNRKKENHPLISNRPFSSCLEPLSQSEAKCESIGMKMIVLDIPIFYSHTNATHFHKKGFALSLVLKMRVFGTRKRPITIKFGTSFRPKYLMSFHHFHVFFLFCQFLPETKIGTSLWPNTCNFTKSDLSAETLC